MTQSKFEIRLIMEVLAGIFISNFAVFSAPLIIGGLIDGLAMNESQAGLMVTLEIASVASICVLFSNWLDRFSLRNIALLGGCLTIAANVLSLSQLDVVYLSILRIISGMGAGLCLAASSAIISRSSDPDRLVGIVLGINVLLMTVVLIVMGYAKETWLFNGVAAVFAMSVVLILPFIFLLPKKRVEIITEHQAVSGDGDNYFMLGVLGVSLLFVFCIIESSVWAFSERSGINIGMAETEIGMVLAAGQMAGLLGTLIPTILGGRINRMIPIGFGTLFMGAAGLFIYQTDSQTIYIVSIACFSFGFFMAFPYLVGGCARLDNEGRWAARATGINLFGGAIAPFIAGNVILFMGYKELGFVIMSMAVLCIGLAFMFTRKLTAVPTYKTVPA